MSAGSARGLFRATGNKSKPVAAKMLDGTIAKVEHLEREKDDFYPTPPEPTRAFLHAEIDRLRQFDRIWEPAAGDGAMVREMRAVGLEVGASDIIDRGAGAFICDFYSFLEAQAPSKAIVTNPPFSECGWGNGKARWLKHALDVLDVDYMALLLNWTWPGAGGLAGFWADHPPARVYLMRWKIDFTGQGAPPMLNGWFVWDKAHRGETVLRMLDRKDARQTELFTDSEAA
ncbi:MAG: hypothetical protein EOS65_02510 [Mesorhizobium sp.]|uniref:hypothetical protein n=1 Tax=Mesorhizobium sp. TaxID=1871066 RepID=UPI000FE8601F|nr:hypothetical protein [Mesorhizobium sp.]RWF44268.1 MAG: hypothetical protein EOS65_02510 [Mesorhizobium sp.]